METYKQLEQEFAEFTGMQYASAVNSGTSALHLALLALGVGQGDEVIVPNLTFVACAFAVSYVGATPVFIDCDDTLNMDVALLESKITNKTKAIMAVHVHGRKCAIEKIKEIADKHSLPIIEDMSEGHGIKPVGDIACYSFQESKIIHCEEGGMIATNSKELLDTMNHLKNFAHKDRTYYHDHVSFNYRMPNTIAKIALESLRAVETNLKHRKLIEARFDVYLPKQYKLPGRDVVWVYDFITPNRDVVLQRLKDAGVNARCFFKPLSSLPMYDKGTTPVAEKYSKTGIYIPLNLNQSSPDYLSTEKIREIVKIIDDLAVPHHTTAD